MVTVAVDGMGGDRSPRVVIEGMARVAVRYPRVDFLVFGDEKKILMFLNHKRFSVLKKRTQIIHTNESIKMNESPAVAVRRGGKSSMALAIKAVKTGEAHCVISAGNTGALMGMSKIFIKTVEGIERPAIASFVPTLRGESIMLDLGANIEASPNQLVQFAMMGKTFAKATLGIENPTVRLLNIGSEQLKGRDDIKMAAGKLENLKGKINYTGFVEANQILKGVTDVIVTDGFTGNIALKAMEGASEFLTVGLKKVARSGILARCGFFLASFALKHYFHRMDPRIHNGAVFLGLQAIVVKSHGGTDALGFAHAISIAVDIVDNRLTEEVNRQLPDFIEST